jgi:hypothetical protein
MEFSQIAKKKKQFDDLIIKSTNNIGDNYNNS